MAEPDPEAKVVRVENEDGSSTEEWCEDVDGEVLPYKDWKARGAFLYRRILDKEGKVVESEMLRRKVGE